METDLIDMLDEDLDALRIAILTEQERRARLAQIPAQMADLAQRYVADGGDPADLASTIPSTD